MFASNVYYDKKSDGLASEINVANYLKNFHSNLYRKQSNLAETNIFLFKF